MLRQFPQIKLVKVLEMIEEHLDPSKAGSIPVSISWTLFPMELGMALLNVSLL